MKIVSHVQGYKLGPIGLDMWGSPLPLTPSLPSPFLTHRTHVHCHSIHTTQSCIEKELIVKWELDRLSHVRWSHVAMGMEHYVSLVLSSPQAKDFSHVFG